MKKQNNQIEIGLDEIILDIPTEYELIENTYDFVSKRTGLIVGNLTHKQGKQRGYRLNINLPKCVHKTNTSPLTIYDFFHFQEIVNMIVEQIQQLFGDNFPALNVSTCEVNSTIVLENKSNVEPMLNMIAHMLLKQDDKICIWVHGTKEGKRYKAVSQLKSGMQVESIKTPVLSNARMALKIYDKSRERNVENKGILRIETIYNRSGLDYAKAGRTLQEFLTVESMKRLLELYRNDYKTYFIDRFWNKSGHPFYKDCVEIILNDLKMLNGQPSTVALINRNIVEWDFDFFCKACKKYYEKSNTAEHAIRRVKNSGEIQIHEGVVDGFVQISKAIING